MPELHSAAGATYVAQLLVCALLAILFLQSGIDKVVDRRGNLEWLTGHFAKSPLAAMVPALLLILTVLEIAAGALAAVGGVMIAIGGDRTVAFYGAALSGLTIVALFFGQRMAKEYPGAASLVPYFLVTLAGIYLLGGR
jgi:uncharacterized membrane protein YphA (DoxX/SURF4 family)